VNKLYRLKDAAERIGVSPVTLKRWLIAGKVAEVRRDRNKWRVFTDADIARIRAYAESVHEPDEA
jgi:DNA (cytosine-5)-methyltransferase 1